MGLFSKKKQMVEYDKVESERQKKIMREIFNEAVSEGETYQIFLATELSSKYEKGLFLDTNTTTYYYYIFGFREKDKKMFMVQVDPELVNYSHPIAIEVDTLKDISFNKKYDEVCLEYKKEVGMFGEVMKIHDYGKKTMGGISNLYQETERNAFLDFLEDVRKEMTENGYTLSKWKRE